MRLNPYLRIMQGAKSGKGVHLSADEVYFMSFDSSIAQTAANLLDGSEVNGGFYTADKNGFNRKEDDRC